MAAGLLVKMELYIYVCQGVRGLFWVGYFYLLNVNCLRNLNFRDGVCGFQILRVLSRSAHVDIIYPAILNSILPLEFFFLVYIF